MIRPTPKTLKEALRNGLDDAEAEATAKSEMDEGELSPDEYDAIIQKHIRDFLSQKFQLFIGHSKPDEVQGTIDATARLLWLKITGETI